MESYFDSSKTVTDFTLGIMSQMQDNGLLSDKFKGTSAGPVGEDGHIPPLFTELQPHVRALLTEATAEKLPYGFVADPIRKQEAFEAMQAQGALAAHTTLDDITDIIAAKLSVREASAARKPGFAAAL